MLLHGPHGTARGTVRAFTALKQANHAPWDPQRGARAASEGGAPSAPPVPCSAHWAAADEMAIARPPQLLPAALQLATNTAAAAVLAAAWGAAGVYFFVVPRMKKPATVGAVWVER
jgi:hypothetical protein